MKRDGKKIRVIIADHEPFVRDCIRAALAAESDMQVIAECCGVNETTSAVQAFRPDLLMIGMRMPDGSAVDVIERVGPDRISNVIFLTRADDDAARALDAHALDYLSAPFTDEQMRALLDAFRARRTSNHLPDRLDERLSDFLANRETPTVEPGAQRALTRFMIRERDRIRFVSAEDVDWIEGARNYVRLHAGEKTHLLRGPLTAIHAQLEPSMFARIHRSIIVNVDRIAEVQPWVGGDYVAILRSGERLRVSRNFRNAVLHSPIKASAPVKASA